MSERRSTDFVHMKQLILQNWILPPIYMAFGHFDKGSRAKVRDRYSTSEQNSRLEPPAILLPMSTQLHGELQR